LNFASLGVDYLIGHRLDAGIQGLTFTFILLMRNYYRIHSFSMKAVVTIDPSATAIAVTGYCFNFKNNTPNEALLVVRADNHNNLVPLLQAYILGFTPKRILF
jgi:hypothetical protein